MKLTQSISFKFFCLTVLMGISQSIFASAITVPEGLSPGDQYRLVFVTTGLHDASSTDITIYNSFVNVQANDSATLTSLAANWNVVGSTSSIDAITNTSTDPVSTGVPVYNLNGLLVASDNSDLWDGNLANPVNVDQYGNSLVGAVFTGTGTNGMGISNRELGSNESRVQYGNSGLTGSGWTTIDWSGSLNSLHLYGISEVLEVPDVPEPVTVLLLGLGGLAISRRR